MNSLVGYGVSSESDSDGEDVNNDGAGSVEEASHEGVKRTRNFLLEAGSASSDSEPEPEDPEPPSAPLRPRAPEASVCARPTLPAPSPGSLTPNKLPPPSLNACSDSSVFANPFKAQADQKLSALQKHVPLTMQAKPSQIGGKRMCVSYRKDGRCRFGIKCKFAHDSDLQTPVTPADCQLSESEQTGVSDQVDSQDLQRETEEEESGGQQGKKRRVGLSNSLIPPKRAMKQYAMLRDTERINM